MKLFRNRQMKTFTFGGIREDQEVGISFFTDRTSSMAAVIPLAEYVPPADDRHF